MIEKKIYFDYAAATPLLPEVIEAMQPYFINKFYNPSALYLDAKTNKKDLEDFRSVISRGIGSKPSEIIFTAGGTEANNLAIQGIMRSFPGKKLIVSAIEHESVLEPAKAYDYKVAAVDKHGLVDLKRLEEQIDDQTVLISVMYANNEIGTIEPIKDISVLVKKINKSRLAKGLILPLYLHCDACQASNYLDMQVGRLGVDLMTINSGKNYGPKQCGALYVKSGVKLKPLVLGGGQERNLRSGTENLANIAGFATAWQIVREDYKEESKKLALLRDNFVKELQARLPNVRLNGPRGDNRLANNISVTFKGLDNEILTMKLDEFGFMAATGSACSASKEVPSHVLRAIGLTDEYIRGTIRITLGRFTTKEQLDDLLKTLIKIVEI